MSVNVSVIPHDYLKILWCSDIHKLSPTKQ